MAVEVTNREWKCLIAVLRMSSDPDRWRDSWYWAWCQEQLDKLDERARAVVVEE